jgi:hypothetical protein
MDIPYNRGWMQVIGNRFIEILVAKNFKKGPGI